MYALTGNASIRNAPGIMALFTTLPASIAARRNRSSVVVMLRLYVTFMTSDATALVTVVWREVQEQATINKTYNSA